MPRGKQSKGTCTYCGAEIAKSGVIKHLSTCSKRQAILEKAGRKRTEHEALHHLRVQDAWRSEFWLDLEVRGSSTLKDLDAYLRHIWLECCGHLSRFSPELHPKRRSKREEPERADLRPYARLPSWHAI